ncbi:unnamed protein product (macronuclear) [Paramecium tetraurelia]|uniref:Uncharacterized protein n=1 Tax=Paramecium tetraurelia TaxID=5888 RepID=A0CLT6_PARTE|nr:uncharacterized protein GSPATT00038678001 [Paramecium tetraurelia]CAK71753.1 unnamed protein product [Paramecium tetraurelia]|eukprot:XP_001439150.1 hypothetical protein (macronuclear) [Paramecium tetraurelia strain d4-2]
MIGHPLYNICAIRLSSKLSQYFIAISSSEVKVAKIKVSYHNYLKTEFWNKYYDIELQNDLNQIEVNYMIEQNALNQKIKEELCKQQLINSPHKMDKSQYLIARSSSILDIITRGSGIYCLFLNQFAFKSGIRRINKYTFIKQQFNIDVIIFQFHRSSQSVSPCDHIF